MWSRTAVPSTSYTSRKLAQGIGPARRTKTRSARVVRRSGTPARARGRALDVLLLRDDVLERVLVLDDVASRLRRAATRAPGRSVPLRPAPRAGRRRTARRTRSRACPAPPSPSRRTGTRPARRPSGRSGSRRAAPRGRRTRGGRSSPAPASSPRAARPRSSPRPTAGTPRGPGAPEHVERQEHGRAGGEGPRGAGRRPRPAALVRLQRVREDSARRSGGHPPAARRARRRPCPSAPMPRRAPSPARGGGRARAGRPPGPAASGRAAAAIPGRGRGRPASRGGSAPVAPSADDLEGRVEVRGPPAGLLAERHAAKVDADRQETADAAGVVRAGRGRARGAACRTRLPGPRLSTGAAGTRLRASTRLRPRASRPAPRAGVPSRRACAAARPPPASG